MSEKVLRTSKLGVYVFDLPVSANKNTVAAAVAAQFDVKIIEFIEPSGQRLKTIREIMGRNSHKVFEDPTRSGLMFCWLRDSLCRSFKL